MTERRDCGGDPIIHTILKLGELDAILRIG
jgi:hypothetical protein